MLLELGGLRISTGVHRHAGVNVAKGLGPGGYVNPAGTDLVGQLAANAPGSAEAVGTRPDPGPLPPASEPFTDPLKHQLHVGVNYHWTPRRDYDQTAFQVLKNFAEICWVPRVCIETRKDQMESLDYLISVRKGFTADPGKQKALQTFFSKPDGVNSWSAWLRLVLEEVLVKDALTLYRRKNRKGDLFGAEVIDGSTIKVLVDQNGRIPIAPEKSFRQIIWGQPTSLGDYTTDEIYYLPRTVRTDTPYGFSPIEWVLMTILTVLNRQTFQLAYFAEGNIPAGLLEMPAGLTKDQIELYNAYISDAMSGNIAARQRLKPVPSGTKLQQFQKADWSTDFEEYLVKVCGAAFGVPPSEIGFTNDVNKATGSQQENVVYRRGVKPMGRFIKGICDLILANDLSAPEYEFTFTGGEPEDVLKKAQADTLYVKSGVKSVDDVRVPMGLPELGIGPMIVTATGPVMLGAFASQVDIAGVPDPEIAVDDDGGDATSSPRPPKKPQAPQAAAPGTQPEETGAPDERTVAGSAPAAAASEIKVWRARAIKDVKKGGRVRPFVAHAIPAGAAAVLAVRLETAKTVDDVVQAFARPVLKVRASTMYLKRRRQAALEQPLRTFFAEQGRALVNHLHSREAR